MELSGDGTIVGSALAEGRFVALRAPLVAVALALLLVPAARSDSTPVLWSSPTPADQTRYTVTVGAHVAFQLSATASDPAAVVHIGVVQGLPSGASLVVSDANTAHGTFKWTPLQPGNYSLRFTAAVVGGSDIASPLAFNVHVNAKVAKAVYPRAYALTNDAVAHWAAVARRVPAHSAPRASAPAVATLDTWTTDGTQNIVLVLNAVDVSKRETWYRVRLPILPNNSTGWVRSSDLGSLWSVHTHLYVDREHFRATLTRDGKVVFRSIVGVGKSYWPTPRGEFYIRDKLTSFNDPFYGPIAFGTSARSATLTDWPGGGFVGVHGTNQPEILPGRVSHGCIRMRNASILKLARLMPVGTPLTIT
jgi:hypothetical protein